MKKIIILILFFSSNYATSKDSLIENDELLKLATSYRHYVTQLGIFIDQELRYDDMNYYIAMVNKFVVDLESNSRWFIIKAKKSRNANSPKLKDYFYNWLTYKHNIVIKRTPYQGYRYPERITHTLKMIAFIHCQLKDFFIQNNQNIKDGSNCL